MATFHAGQRGRAGLREKSLPEPTDACGPVAPAQGPQFEKAQLEKTQLEKTQRELYAVGIAIR
jgi:hypothetical protein